MTVARLKSLDPADRKSDKARLNQLIDIISSDISSEANRRKYPAFVSGATTPITSSLYNTIFDQDHTLQSSNALFDMSFGIYAFTKNVSNTLTIDGSSVATSLSGTIDSAGKYNFSAAESNMMREKINIYRQYAQALLGNSNGVFRNSHRADVTVDSTKIQEALFINVKRLFKRDNIAKGTVAMKFYNRTGNRTLLTDDDAHALSGTLFTSPLDGNFVGRSKLNAGDTAINTYSTNQITILDANASVSYSAESVAGEVATLKMFLGDPNASSIDVGVIYYDMGIMVLDVNKIFDLNDTVQGVINFPDATPQTVIFTLSGAEAQSVTLVAGQKPIGNGNTSATLKTFLQLATIDDIIKHFCESRFIDNSNTAITFQNETIINSTIFFCRAAASDFNYSTNPTYTDANGKIVVVKTKDDQPFSYITTVGLYNNAGDLLAVAKLSRPIEKNPNNELTIRVRLDY